MVKNFMDVLSLMRKISDLEDELSTLNKELVTLKSELKSKNDGCLESLKNFSLGD